MDNAGRLCLRYPSHHQALGGPCRGMAHWTLVCMPQSRPQEVASAHRCGETWYESPADSFETTHLKRARLYCIGHGQVFHDRC